MSDGRRRFLVLFRLVAPVLLFAGAYLMRDNLVATFERLFGVWIAGDIVYLFATVQARLLVALVGLIVCTSVLFLLSRRLRGLVLDAAFVAAIAVLGSSAGYQWYGPEAIAFWIAVGLIVAFNSVRSQHAEALLTSRIFGRLADLGFGASIFLSEALAPRAYAQWARVRLGAGLGVDGEAFPSLLRRYAVSLLLAAAVFGLHARFQAMAELNQALFRSPNTEPITPPDFSRLARYSFAGMALSPGRDKLYVCGNSVDVIHVIDLRARPYTLSPTGIGTGGNQFCTMDPVRNRLVIIDRVANALRTAPIGDLSRVSSVPVAPFPTGEVFIDVNLATDTYVVGSEAFSRFERGPAVRAYDAATLEPVVEIDFKPGYLITHPEKGIVYFNHWIRGKGVHAYDILTGRKIASAPADNRGDRMLVDLPRNRLLVTSPVWSRVQAYDADTLEPQGQIAAIFGVRSLAIDKRRNLMLAASFISNHVAVIDLNENKIIRRYWVGPWLRDIVLDEEAGRAYISSFWGIYGLDYLL